MADTKALAREALEAAKKELTHNVPEDCWATGPLTGNPVEDLLVCPGCRTIKKIDSALDALAPTDAAPSPLVEIPMTWIDDILGALQNGGHALLTCMKADPDFKAFEVWLRRSNDIYQRLEPIRSKKGAFTADGYERYAKAVVDELRAKAAPSDLAALRERGRAIADRLWVKAGDSQDSGYAADAQTIDDLLAAIPTARTEAAVPDEVRRLAEQAIYDFNKATEICKAQGQRSPLINREVKLARALLGKAGE